MTTHRRSSALSSRFFRGRTPKDPARVIADADALLAKGRAEKAVEYLTDANHRDRDVRIEHQLIDARFEAFAACPRRAERPEWPESVPDLFPDAVIPEIECSALSADSLRSAITHHGSLIIRGFARPEQVENSVANIDRAFAAYDAMPDPKSPPPFEESPPDLAGWFAPYKHDRVSDRKLKRESGSILAVDSPPAMCALIDLFEEARVGALMNDYFGERPALLARKWSLRRVPHDALTGDWHQDGAFMGAGIRSLNIWLGLTHCGDSAPGIDVVGRRLDHIVETGTGGAFFSWSVGPAVAEAVADGRIVRPVFDAGDAMIFDHLCLHRTAVDPGMANDRHAVEAWFLAPSTYETMLGTGTGNDAPRDQIPLSY